GVVLDLQSFTLSQDTTAPVANVNGIAIANGLSNVMITNGKIRDFTNIGINGSSTLARIAIKDLTLYNCLQGAISLVGAASPRNNTLYLTNCKALLCGQSTINSQIISITNTDDVFIDSVSIMRATKTAGSLVGFSLASSNNAI